MKTLILITTLTLVLVSCAHRHRRIVYSSHECAEKCKLHRKGVAYDKNCAQSILEGKVSVKGKEDLNIQYGGQAYYFSSSKKMDAFNKNLVKNIDSADKRWMTRDNPRI